MLEAVSQVLTPPWLMKHVGKGGELFNLVTGAEMFVMCLLNVCTYLLT